MTDAVMTSAEFFRLVDEFLTPQMALLGYHRIGGSENDQPMSRGMLTPVGARLSRASRQRTLPSSCTTSASRLAAMTFSD